MHIVLKEGIFPHYPTGFCLIISQNACKVMRLQIASFAWRVDCVRVCVVLRVCMTPFPCARLHDKLWVVLTNMCTYLWSTLNHLCLCFAKPHLFQFVMAVFLPLVFTIRHILRPGARRQQSHYVQGWVTFGAFFVCVSYLSQQSVLLMLH